MQTEKTNEFLRKDEDKDIAESDKPIPQYMLSMLKIKTKNNPFSEETQNTARIKICEQECEEQRYSL